MELKRILITGINGFVGTNLCNALSKDDNIVGLDVFRDPNKETKYVKWDSLGEIQNLYCIIHLAGKAHDTKNTSSEQDYFDVNLGLTQKIFDYFCASNAEKFILFSSVKAVADSVVGEFLSEKSLPNPRTAYGRSKLAAEKYILSKPLHPNKKVYIFRPSMIHGAGNKGNLNLLYSFIKRGLPYPLLAYQNLRSFCSIDNLIYIVRQILESDVEAGIYNICDDKPLSTSELVELIYQSLGKQNRGLVIPKGYINLVAKTGDLFHLPINSERLKKMTESYIVSNQKIKKALKINLLPFESKEGMIRTFQSFSE